MIRFLFVVAALSLVTACSPRDQKAKALAPAVPVETGLVSLKHNEFIKDQELFADRPARAIDVESYDLVGHFDWERNLLKATVTITLNRPTDLGTIELDSLVDRVLRVRSDDGRDLAFASDTSEGLLKITIPAEVTSTRLRLLIDYEVIGGRQSDQGRRRRLMVIPARKGDPVQSAVLFTSAEPRGAPGWLPCNDRPADRALFTTRFSMSESQRFIANGRLLRDEASEGVRTVEYRTDHPLPTYLMAFAQGDFVSAQRQHGALPISIWARRGVAVDFQGLLDETDRQISTFERLLVPYPFEKYAIILIPEFGGGMEHASITFNDEQSSSQRLPSDLSLMGHELGHQWFGDLITVKTWDDLWIKEGMATLLAAESSRPYEDMNASGALMGHSFAAVSGDAMRDRAQEPENKYHTGPYGRSAWFLTQLRSIVGENAFWGTLRKILTEHAYGSISSEEFLAEFRPHLSEGLYAKALAAIDAHEMPQLHAQRKDETLRLSLSDTEGALLKPFEIIEKSVSGEEKHLFLQPGASIELKKTPGHLTALDPNDVHSRLEFWIRGDDGVSELKSLGTGLDHLQIPTTTEEVAIFTALPAATQKRAVGQGLLWKPMPASEFSTIRSSLGSSSARFAAINLACRLAKDPTLATTASEGEKAAWRALVDEMLLSPPVLGASAWAIHLEDCRDQIPQALLGRVDLLSRNPRSPFLSEIETLYLELLPIQNHFATWAAIVKEGASLRTRVFPLVDMVKDSKPELADADFRRHFFRDLLAETEVSAMQKTAIAGLAALKDQEALPLLAKAALASTSPRFTPELAICAGWQITQGRSELWRDFKAQLRQVRTELQDYLKDPEKKCREVEPYKRP